MSPCKNCGANLPDEARFCLQCGTAVDRETPQPTPPPGEQAPLDFVQPSLAGGMLLGVLSNLPFVSCLCCLWVLGGGGIASFLLLKQRPSGITLGDGAFVGVLSGVVGAIVGTIVSIPVRLIQSRLFTSPPPEQLEEMLRGFGLEGMEGAMRDLMQRMASNEISAATLAVTFFSYLLMYPLFAMIGGILTVAILNRRKATL